MKNLILYWICISMGSFTFGQAGELFLQKDTITIGGGAKSYLSYLTEKVYLHTDRDIYSPGDDIWFKAYLVDGLSHELSDSSGILYVELISPDSRIITRRIIKLKNGLGNGDIDLPENLPAGDYFLRVYTNYLRNFGKQSFFYKNITLTTGTELHLPSSISDSPEYKNTQSEFQFFPEGGSLVGDVLSVVAFKAVDSYGRGCEVTGQVHSSSGELITTLRSSHLGMGKFSLKPEEGVRYTATITYPDGSTIRKNIPAPFGTGFVLNAERTNLNETLITLRTNAETFSIYQDSVIMVTVSSHGRILKVLPVKIDSLDTDFVLPEEGIPNGIVMVTMFGHDDKPLCERLIYIDNKPGIVVDFKPDKQLYQKRDSVLMMFSLIDNRESENYAFLSLSVSNNIYSNSSSTTISSWFLLESDVRGPVEDPASYFDYSNPMRLRNLDLLLLTQGWRDFEWKFRDDKYIPEKSFTISGRLRKQIQNVPVINQEVTLAVFQDEKNIITNTRTDSSGRFRFYIGNLTGKSRIVLCAVNKRGNAAGLLVLDSLHNTAQLTTEDHVSRLMSKSMHESPDTSLIKATHELKRTFRRKYSLSDTILIDEVEIAGKRKETAQEMRINLSRNWYGIPDKEIVITPLLRTAINFKELLIGRIPGITFVRPVSANDSGIRMRGISSMMAGREPVFMLDGMIVPYFQVLSIPVSFIDRIDVIQSERASSWGMRGVNGVISIITRTSSDYSDTELPHSVNRAFEGFNNPRIFFSTEHTTILEKDYKPDLRSTLLWRPNIMVTVNKKYRVKFFNGDIPSVYRLVIEGITSDGVPVTGYLEYNISE